MKLLEYAEYPRQKKNNERMYQKDRGLYESLELYEVVLSLC